MKEKDIDKILEDFKEDFQLTDEQIKHIRHDYIRVYTPGFMKRARKMDALWKEMKKFSTDPVILRLLLFVFYDKDLKKGYFDKVIESVAVLKESVY